MTSPSTSICHHQKTRTQSPSTHVSGTYHTEARKAEKRENAGEPGAEDPSCTGHSKVRANGRGHRGRGRTRQLRCKDWNESCGLNRDFQALFILKSWAIQEGKQPKKISLLPSFLNVISSSAEQLQWAGRGRSLSFTSAHQMQIHLQQLLAIHGDMAATVHAAFSEQAQFFFH